MVRPPGEQKGVVRRSLAYLVRAEDGGSMARLGGEGIPREGEEKRSVGEWTEERVRMIMKGNK